MQKALSEDFSLIFLLLYVHNGYPSLSFKRGNVCSNRGLATWKGTQIKRYSKFWGKRFWINGLVWESDSCSSCIHVLIVSLLHKLTAPLCLIFHVILYRLPGIMTEGVRNCFLSKQQFCINCHTILHTHHTKLSPSLAPMDQKEAKISESTFFAMYSLNTNNLFTHNQRCLSNRDH